MTLSNFLTFSFILFGLLCIARAQYVIHVDALIGIDIQTCGNVSYPCHTIRYAVDLAFGANYPAGSDINIQINATAGPYAEPPNTFVTIPPAAILQTPALINITGDDLHKAVIDCKGEEGWTIKGFSGLMTFRGLEFRNCTSNAANDGNGGCVFFQDTQLTRPDSDAHRFEHVQFDHCVATANGGAVYISSSTRIDLVDVSFTNNEVLGTGVDLASGGAAYIEITAADKPIFYERGYVRNNFVHGSGNMQLFGAGLYIRAGVNIQNVSTLEMLSVEFTGNELDIAGTNDSTFGGGMYLADFGGEFIDVTLDGNVAEYGGGIFFSAHNQFLDLCSETISIVNNKGWGLYVILGEARTWEEKMTGNLPDANRATYPGVISECRVPPPITPEKKSNKTGIIVAIFVVLLAVAIGVAISGYYFYKKRVAYRTV